MVFGPTFVHFTHLVIISILLNGEVVQNLGTLADRYLAQISQNFFRGGRFQDNGDNSDLHLSFKALDFLLLIFKVRQNHELY